MTRLRKMMLDDPGCELVAESGNCDDERRPLRVLFQFLAQAGDVDIHSPGKRLGTVCPHFFQQEVTRQRGTPVLHEVPQQLESRADSAKLRTQVEGRRKI